MEPQAATPPAPATAPKAVTAAGPLGAYERWFNAHTGVARNMETMLYIAPQLVPVRSKELSGDRSIGLHHRQLV